MGVGARVVQRAAKAGDIDCKMARLAGALGLPRRKERHTLVPVRITRRSSLSGTLSFGGSRGVARRALRGGGRRAKWQC